MRFLGGNRVQEWEYQEEIFCLDDCITYKPRGASPLGQFLLVGPLFLCVEKVRGRK